jgi:predicted nucleotidyltransferase
MFTRKALNQVIHNFISDIKLAGYNPSRIVLFGSYAYGRPHATSDIDLAIWDKLFTGCGTVDIAPLASIVSKYPQLELHTFSEQDYNPFAEEILKKGVIVFDKKMILDFF